MSGKTFPSQFANKHDRLMTISIKLPKRGPNMQLTTMQYGGAICLAKLPANL